MLRHEGRLLRQVNPIYRAAYDQMMVSGLYEDLTQRGLLVAHREVEPAGIASPDAYKLLEPERIAFVSYPYEWSFSQLRAAALATLAIQQLALKHGMSLKDSSAYNIQFVDTKPVLMDTLSFEPYQEGQPWVAYRQFCQHFLAPLALMSCCDIRLGLLLRDFIDGVPLDLAASLLPWRTCFNFGLLTHLHLHAAAQKRYTGKDVSKQQRGARISQQQLTALIESLRSAVRGLTWKPDQTAWADYYQGDSYTRAGAAHKETVVREFLAETGIRSVLDLGANTGRFSRIASGAGIFTISADFDPGAVEINFRQAVEEKAANLLPLVIDLTNPSPALGWASAEREAFVERCQVDAVMALALIHHLAIANNVPLPDIAALFARLGEWLIVEFVPKSDPKVQTLLATRQDIFPGYTPEGFEAAFRTQYEIVRAEPIAESDRRLYLMRRSVS